MRDLLFLPCAPRFGRSTAGAHTVVLLPDGTSTMTVNGCADDRWRSFNGSTIIVWATLHGPATRLTAHELFAAFPGCRSLGTPGRYGIREIGFDQHTRLTLLRALPHSCGAEPGRGCHRRGWQGPCMSPAWTAVAVPGATA